MPGQTPPVPGPPAAVLSAVLVGGPAYGTRRQAVFSTTGAPTLPSMMTEVVWLPADAQLDADVTVLGTLISQGWATGNVTKVTASYTALPTDAVILANATSAALTVTLPDATQPGFFTGQRYSVVKTDSSVNNVTITGTAGQLIDGAASITLSGANAYTAVVFDGASWWVWTGFTTVGSSPSGTAGGGLSGSYPNPVVAKVGLLPTGDTTGAADYTAIQNALNAANPGSTVYLAAGTFYVKQPLLIPVGVTLQGAGPATQSGDATGMDWQTTVKPVASGWSLTYQSTALPVYTGIANTDSTMNGTTALGFTGTFTVQDIPYSLDGYPSSGTVQVVTSTSQTATMTYSGLTATITGPVNGVITVTNQLTGCAVTNSPTGTFATGNAVTCNSMLYGRGGTIYMVDMVSLGTANPKVPRGGVVNLWVDGSSGPAGLDGIFSWGQVTAFTIAGVGINQPTGNGIGGYQNGAFGTGLAAGSNEPDGWNVRDVIVEKGQYHGLWGFFQDSTFINVHPQQNAQSGVTGDGFVITWSHNLLTGCRADLNFNGFTLMDQGGMASSQYWACTEFNGCTTQRNKHYGFARYNTGVNGQTQQSPTKVVDCAFEGDGTAGGYAAIFASGRNVIDLSGTSVHPYELDVNTGAPAYALRLAGQGTGPGYPGVVHWKGGFASAATAFLDPNGGQAFLTDIDIVGYCAGPYFNQSSTPPYTIRTHQTATPTSTYTVRPQDEYVTANVSSGAFTATLPCSGGQPQVGASAHNPPSTGGYDPVLAGKRVSFTKTDSTPSALTIAGYSQATTTASAMNLVAAPGFTGTFTAASTSGLPTAGSATVALSSGTCTLSWTGIGSSTTLTGCTTSGAGGGTTFVTSGAVTFQDQVNGLNSVQLQAQWQRAEVLWNGSAWNVVSGSAAAAPAYLTPSAPASTTSTSLVFMGLGATYQYTPVSTGQVSGQILGFAQTATAAALVTCKALYGTVAGPATTVAAGSNGAAAISTIASWAQPSAGVLDVASTAGYAASGTIWVTTSGSNQPAQVSYTGTSGGNSFTGCAFVQGGNAGANTIATGNSVTGWPQNGAIAAGTGTQIGVQIAVKGGAATSPATAEVLLGTNGGSGPLVLPVNSAQWLDWAIQTGSGSDAAEIIQNMLYIAEAA